MNLASIQGLFPSHYEAYFVSQDGEGDDIQAQVIASLASKEEEISVNCTIGNKDIVHTSATDAKKEMEARMELTDQLFFGRKVALHGSETKKGISEKYVARIQELAHEKNCLVLHTDSFASLRELFTRAKPGELKNVVILSYGSVNLGWILPKDDPVEKEKVCREFYEALEKSGAKMIQVDGFPFLGTRNKLTPANTPLTFSLLEHLDGSAGLKWQEVNRNAVANVLKGQANKVASVICQAMNRANSSQQEELKSLVIQMLELLGCDVQEEGVFTNAELLGALLNRSLAFEQHVKFEPVLKPVAQLVATILGVKQVDLDRDFNVYAGTSLRDQGLIADQLPALLFSELKEGQKHGLLQECLPVQFSGFNGRFLTFAVRDMNSCLFYLNTRDKVKQMSTAASEEECIDSYLKYIDLSLAASLLAHSEMITPQKKEKLFASSFKERFTALTEKVQKQGFDLPSFCTQLIASVSLEKVKKF